MYFSICHVYFFVFTITYDFFKTSIYLVIHIVILKTGFCRTLLVVFVFARHWSAEPFSAGTNTAKKKRFLATALLEKIEEKWVWLWFLPSVAIHFGASAILVIFVVANAICWNNSIRKIKCSFVSPTTTTRAEEEKLQTLKIDFSFVSSPFQPVLGIEFQLYSWDCYATKWSVKTENLHSNLGCRSLTFVGWNVIFIHQFGEFLSGQPPVLVTVALLDESLDAKLSEINKVNELIFHSRPLLGRRRKIHSKHSVGKSSFAL